MVASSSKFTTVQICADGSNGLATAQIEVPYDNSSPDQADHLKKTNPCAFSALSMSALSGADWPYLSITLIFILLSVFMPIIALSIQSSLPPRASPQHRSTQMQTAKSQPALTELRLLHGNRVRLL